MANAVELDGCHRFLHFCIVPHLERVGPECMERVELGQLQINQLSLLNREIRRRTRVVGTFPDGNSALMLVCARLRHVAGTQWGNKKYMNMKHLEAAFEDVSIAG